MAEERQGSRGARSYGNHRSNEGAGKRFRSRQGGQVKGNGSSGKSGGFHKGRNRQDDGERRRYDGTSRPRSYEHGDGSGDTASGSSHGGGRRSDRSRYGSDQRGYGKGRDRQDRHNHRSNDDNTAHGGPWKSYGDHGGNGHSDSADGRRDRRTYGSRSRSGPYRGNRQGQGATRDYGEAVGRPEHSSHDGGRNYGERGYSSGFERHSFRRQSGEGSDGRDRYRSRNGRGGGYRSSERGSGDRRQSGDYRSHDDRRGNGGYRSHGNERGNGAYRDHDGGRQSRSYRNRDSDRQPRSYGDRDDNRRNGGYRERDDQHRSHTYGNRDDRRDNRGYRSHGNDHGNGGYRSRDDTRSNGGYRDRKERSDFHEVGHAGPSRRYENRPRVSPAHEHLDEPRRNSDGTISFPSQNPYTDRRPGEPKMPKGMEWSMLSKDEKERLRGLSKEHAENIALHILAAYYLEESDPDAALSHARWVARQASRVDFAREALAFIAYRQGDYKLALREFRTAERMNGYDDYLPFIADCERGLGNPKKAVEIALSDEAKQLNGESKAEMFLVYAGALGDLGLWGKAIDIVHKLASSNGLPGAYRMRAMQAEQNFLEKDGRGSQAADLDSALDKLEMKYAEVDEDDDSDDVVIDYDLEDLPYELMKKIGVDEDKYSDDVDAHEATYSDGNDQLSTTDEEESKPQRQDADTEATQARQPGSYQDEVEDSMNDKGTSDKQIFDEGADAVPHYSDLASGQDEPDIDEQERARASVREDGDDLQLVDGGGRHLGAVDEVENVHESDQDADGDWDDDENELPAQEIEEGAADFDEPADRQSKADKKAQDEGSEASIPGDM